MVIKDICVSSFAEHCTGRNHQHGYDTKEQCTDCRQTVQPWFRNCPTQVNHNRCSCFHARRDECRLRTEARAIGKQRSTPTLDLQRHNKNTHGLRWVHATTVFRYPQIWTPDAFETICSHRLLQRTWNPSSNSLHRWPHLKGTNTQSEALDTTQNQNSQNAENHVTFPDASHV